MNGLRASQLEARTKALAATSHCAHSGSPISPTRLRHWCSSRQRAKTQAPSLHSKKSIGWGGGGDPGLVPRREAERLQRRHVLAVGPAVEPGPAAGGLHRDLVGLVVAVGT